MIDGMILLMIVIILFIGIKAANSWEAPLRPEYKYRVVGKECKKHEWVKDSQNNMFCGNCNKMPFEVKAGEAPSNWWKENL